MIPGGRNEEEEGVQGARPAGGSVLHLRVCACLGPSHLSLCLSVSSHVCPSLYLPLCCWYSLQPFSSFILFLIVKTYKRNRLHTLNHFQLYSSAIFTLWCNRSPELFRLAKRKLCSHSTTTLHSVLLPGIYVES